MALDEETKAAVRDPARLPLLGRIEAARLAAMLSELHERGYRDIIEHESFRVRVGARIRHRGHQWPEAYREGTGFIVALTEKPDSPWSRTYRMPDIELVALWDKPRPFEDSSRLAGLAQYHVEVIEVADV